MITITDKAIKELKIISDEENIGHYNVRFLIRGGGCAGFSYDLFFEEKEFGETDSIFEFEDIKIVVDMLSMQYLDGTEIDYEETLLQSGFKFKSPSVTSACGCGNSVSF